MRRLVMVVVVSLAVAACGARDEPVTTSRGMPRDSAAEALLDRAAIDAQEEVWVATRPAAYSYEVETTCDCRRAGTYSVTVDGESVFGVESRQADAEPHRLYPAPILDETFAMLEEPLALSEDGEISTGQASAIFDPTYGYPASFSVVGSDGLPSYHVEIRAFMPLDPAVLDRLPALALVVSNQSFEDPDVGLTVSVDDEVVVDRTFAVEGQHTYVSYRVPLDAGDHQLKIRADTGASHQRVVTLAADRHVYVGYWGGDPTTHEVFSVSESDEPFGFG